MLQNYDSHTCNTAVFEPIAGNDDRFDDGI